MTKPALKTLAAIALTSSFLGLGACSAGGRDADVPTGPAPAPSTPVPPGTLASVETAHSALQRNATPTLSSAEAEAFATSQAEAAVALYRAVSSKKPGEDVFLSPHSISVALAMAYAGARGETAAEMQRALHFDLPGDRLHTAFNYVDLELSRRALGERLDGAKRFQLGIANSIWAQKDYPFETPFLDTLAVSYGAGLNLVDFKTAANPARLAINGWVEEKTERRIKDLLGEGAVGATTRMVLVNAVYFNASWTSGFDESATRPAPFTKSDGAKVDVPMMHGTANRAYAKEDAFEAIALPYVGDDLAMLVIAPTAGTFDAFEASLTGTKVLDIFGRLGSANIDLAFPKLHVEASFSLGGPLESLGMKRAFSAEQADLTGIANPKVTNEPLYIASVLHKTFLAVDEKGTEAAAATAVIGATTTSMPPPPTPMTVDRPFVLAIIDRATKTLVFLGRIVAPTPG